MLFVPWGWDQPDNAIRAERLGSALWIRKDKYSTNAAAIALDRLRSEEAFSRNATAAAMHVQQESGLTQAAHSIMGILG